MAEDDFQPEVLWGSNQEERFSAENVLSDEIDFKNSVHFKMDMQNQLLIL